MKPIRNPGYLLRIRTLPCSVWLTTRAVEAAHNYRWPNPSCPARGGTGRSTRTTLVAGLDALNGEIDELASTAGDICTPAKTLLDLAWWHRENAIRAGDGKVRNSQQTGGRPRPRGGPCLRLAQAGRGRSARSRGLSHDLESARMAE